MDAAGVGQRQPSEQNELFRRLRRAALQRDDELAMLDAYYEDHDQIGTGGAAIVRVREVVRR